jgi:transcriptional regulator with XRE-family HTH domain
MNTRLKQFLAAENISQSQFADTIKVVRASVSHVLSGRNNPSYEFIRAIMLSYPNLNMEWLLVGKGRMYKESTSALPAAEPIPTMSDLLFGEYEIDEPNEETTAPESPIDVQVNTQEPSAQSLSNINTSNNNTQSPIKQRKVSKIIIMYDDGSYQEM